MAIDLIGRRFIHLEVVGFGGVRPVVNGRRPERLWECHCHNCGLKCLVTTSDLTGGRVWHCPNCKPSLKTIDYRKDYKTYREQFTPEQRSYYDQIMRTRKGTRAEADAVDVVMREFHNAA
jgi:hypothetical protein